MRIIFMLSLSARSSRERELFIVQKSINLERRVTWQWFLGWKLSRKFSLISIIHFCFAMHNIQFVCLPSMGSKYLKAWKIGVQNFSTPGRNENGRTEMQEKMGAWSRANNKKIVRLSCACLYPSNSSNVSLFFSSSLLNTFQINFEFLLFDGFGSMLFLMFNFTATGWWWWCWLEHISWYPSFLRFSSHWRHHSHSNGIQQPLDVRKSEEKGEEEGKKVFHVTGILMNNGRGRGETLVWRENGKIQ